MEDEMELVEWQEYIVCTLGEWSDLMITDAFDKSEVLFGPKDFYGEKKILCDKCIMPYKISIFDLMILPLGRE